MKKRKFEDGGDIEDMTPQDVEDAKNRRKAGRAFDEAMPEPDTTFGKLKKSARRGGISGGMAGIPDRRPPGQYDSIRSKGFEAGIDAEKSAAMKQGLSGVGQMAKQAAIAALSGPLGALIADTGEGIRGGKKSINAYEKFKEASDKQDAADREMASQLRRETRGVEFKQGGKVKPAKFMSFSKTGKPAGMKSVTKMASGGSASKRADGIATKGKTRGKMC
jgi:hypothetical protein